MAQDEPAGYMRPPGSIVNLDEKALAGSGEMVVANFDPGAILETQCGAIDDSQHVEYYKGNLGPSEAFVALRQPSTGQIQWNDDLAAVFDKPGDDPGNVAGMRWCSGTLIGEDLFLTAAHCVRVAEAAGLWPGFPRTPSRQGADGRLYAPPAELATLMHVNFNYQVAKDSGELRVPDVYPVGELVEFGDDRPDPDGRTYDYAILRLGAGADGQLPGASYRVADFDATAAALAAARDLTIVQHPMGDPKKIEAGPPLTVAGWQIQYDDLDTFGGASGSGIIDDQGAVIGVHTNGGCREVTGGFNYGVSLNAVSKVSEIVR
jgi:V8-like Glu-specific endopeptidase